VIATFGRGIWVLDDYSLLRQITAATEQQPAHLFAPGAGVRVRRNIGGDTPFPPEISHADNPPLGVVIYYSLTKAPAAPITIEILDAAGRVVRHMSSAAIAPIAATLRPFPDWWLSPPRPLPAEVGVNRINWNLRYDDPPSTGEHVTIRAVPGDTPMSYEGPLALPGLYTVRLTVDGTKVTQTVRVRNDPRSTATLPDLRAQHALQMRIYDGAKAADTAARQVRDLLAAVGRLSMTDPLRGPADALTKRIGGRALPFVEIVNSMDALGEELDSADMAPTPAMTGAYAGVCRNLRAALTTWRAAQTSELAKLNAALTASGAAPISLPMEIAMPVCR